MNDATPSRAGMSEKTAAQAESILAGTAKGSLLGRLLPFLGPAFIASVAYVDPGNYATNIQAGAQFGYGFRALEAILTAFVAVVALCYLIETILDGCVAFGVARGWRGYLLIEPVTGEGAASR